MNVEPLPNGETGDGEGPKLPYEPVGWLISGPICPKPLPGAANIPLLLPMKPDCGLGWKPVCIGA